MVIETNAGEALYKAGLVPERCTRAIFDLNANGESTVTCTVFLTSEQVETFTKTLGDYLESLK